MPTEISPATVEELAGTLRECGENKRSIELGGNFTKRGMGGAVAPADITVSTRRLNQIILYEPKDLTISVAAGMKFRDLSEALLAQGQMLPLDPPFGGDATVGGVIATNGSGPRRRRYGTSRDMVIGMSVATLEGSVVQSGGMVVKNVTGLDMAKLLIGSFGTLGAMASVNFKVFPRPAVERTFVSASNSLDKILEQRRAILKSALQPVALDVVNAGAAAHLPGNLPPGYLLIAEAGGNRATVARYERDYQRLGKESGVDSFLSIGDENAARTWQAVQDLTPAAAGPQGFILRVSTAPARLGEIFRLATPANGSLPILARGGTAVGYVFCPSAASAQQAADRAREAGLSVVIEYSGAPDRQNLDQWPEPGPDFELMQRIKDALDPHHLLNKGRLFGRI